MMSDTIDGLFDMIMVKSVSRFTRNLEEVLEKIKELRWLGIELKADDENISIQENEQDFEMTLCAVIVEAENRALSKLK